MTSSRRATRRSSAERCSHSRNATRSVAERRSSAFKTCIQAPISRTVTRSKFVPGYRYTLPRRGVNRWPVCERRGAPQPLAEEGIDDVPGVVTPIDEATSLKSLECRPHAGMAGESVARYDGPARDVLSAPIGQELQGADLICLRLIAIEQDIEHRCELRSLDRLNEPVVRIDHRPQRDRLARRGVGPALPGQPGR